MRPCGSERGIPLPPLFCYSLVIERNVLSPAPSGADRAVTPSTSVPHLDNAFAPDDLAHLREQEEVLTAAEAELAGPWKEEPAPGKPGAVAVLRQWEDLEAGDRPVAVWWHVETARLLTVLLPALDREPLFYIEEGEAPDGYPVVATPGTSAPRPPEDNLERASSC